MEDPVSKAITESVKQQIDQARAKLEIEVKEQVQAASKIQVEKAVSDIKDELSNKMKDSLKTVTAEIQKDYRFKLAISLALVLVTAFSALFGSMSAAREKANESVITLQSDIIEKQKILMTAENSITIAARNVIEGEGNLKKKQAELEAITFRISDSEKKLEALMKEVRDAKNEYDQLTVKVKARGK